MRDEGQTPGLWSEPDSRTGGTQRRAGGRKRAAAGDRPTVSEEARSEGVEPQPGPSTGDNYVDAVDNSARTDAAASTSGSYPHTNGGNQRKSGAADSDATDPNSSDSDASATSAQGPDGESLRGADLARAALQAAREQSKTRGRGRPPKNGRTGTRNARTGARRRGWSGAGTDERDPQSLGRVASRIVADQGWAERLAGGQVFGRWAALVGGEIAEHTKPVALQEGVLTVQAQSTAWATQLRLLQRQIVQRIADGLGQGVVRRIKVQGPAAPSWRYGPRHIPGRGPRDTYG